MRNCTIRTMRQDELNLAIELAAREGWNPGLDDAQCFAEADSEGFLIAEVDGRLAGCLSAVSYDSRFGFIGLYIVVREWRGQGIGMQLWEQGVRRLTGRLIGLDGVPAQEENYRKSGFVLAWRNVRFAGKSHQIRKGNVTAIVPLADVDFAQVRASDRCVFPAPRDRFLRAWIGAPNAIALGFLVGTRLAGWGVIRRCREGHKIGPLVADCEAVASALIGELCNQVPAGDAVYLDVPLPNVQAVKLAEEKGLSAVFETARMYTGAAPECQLEHVFGLTSFELG